MRNIIVIAPSRSGHNFTTAMIQSWVEDSVFKFEGIIPSRYHNVLLTRMQGGRKVNGSAEIINFIQVRDFLNWAASWIKYNLARGTAWNERKVNRVIGEWYAIVREGLNDTSIIGNKYTLFYDQFVQNEAYRRGICSLIDGNYNEKRLGFVPNGGMGSSFDKYRFQDRGHEMDVLTRWKWFLTEEGEYYQRFLKVNKNIIEYYAEKFDLNEGQSNLVNEILK